MDSKRKLWETEGPEVKIYCPLTMVLVDKTSGALADVKKPCSRWRCERCAKRKVKIEVDHAGRCFRDLERLWVKRLPYHSNTLVNIRKQRERAGCESALWVHRDGDSEELFVFTPVELKPKTEVVKAECLSPWDALDVLQSTALALPGVKRTRFIGPWAMGLSADFSDWLCPVGAMGAEAAAWIIEWVMMHVPELASDRIVSAKLVAYWVKRGREAYNEWKLSQDGE